jgi:hypothetical protein
MQYRHPVQHLLCKHLGTAHLVAQQQECSSNRRTTDPCNQCGKFTAHLLPLQVLRCRILLPRLLACCSARGPRAAAVWTAVLPLLYCLFSAIIGTQSVLFSKTLAVLLRSTASGDNQVCCGCVQGGNMYPLAIHC